MCGKNVKPNRKCIVHKMYDYIIVEKHKGDIIPVGSEMYCGCCGHILGVVKTQLTFPFNSHTLRASLKDKTYTESIFGLRHTTCGHSMFSFRKEWGFITLENWNKDQKLHAN